MSIDGIHSTNQGIDDPRSLDKTPETRRKGGSISPQGTPKTTQDDLVALSSKAREMSAVAVGWGVRR